MLRPLPLSKARLEALTDGIFAVTMTLLVLDLKFAQQSASPGNAAGSSATVGIPFLMEGGNRKVAA